MVDRQGRITFVNPTATAMLGWRENELLGQFAYPLFHSSGAEGAPENCPLLDVLNHGIVVTLAEEWFRRREGAHFPLNQHKKQRLLEVIQQIGLQIASNG